MTPLEETLRARIARDGPIGLDAYMEACLLDPAHGYYTTRDPLGAAGDFTTAPEITQMFGELVGLALAQGWLTDARPAQASLAELGPGRGTLMADLWRATAGVPGFHAAMQMQLVEASAPLRAAQAERLAAATPVWLDSVEVLPGDAPLYLVANEFLDALPIRQFVRHAEGWCERIVADGTEGLALGLAPPVQVAPLAHRLRDTVPGDIVEYAPALPGIVAAVAHRIAEHGGLALFIDYGGWRSKADTFQAVSGHTHTDPLVAPGTVDLTAHVDFEAVAAAARGAGAEAWGPEEQGLWLGRLGLVERTQALARAMPEGPGRSAHLAAFRRLTEASEMGTVFKVMAVTAQGVPAPAGFVAPARATGAGPRGAEA